MNTSRDGSRHHGIHHRVPALAECLSALRHALNRWTSEIGMPAQRREELVLAAYEAMANSVEHAYRDATGGILDLRASHDPHGTVTVTVTDYGSWKPPTTSGGIRGRGVPLMRALADAIEIRRTEFGTTVRLTWTLSSRRPSSP